jgi:hypothetical protein
MYVYIFVNLHMNLFVSQNAYVCVDVFMFVRASIFAHANSLRVNVDALMHTVHVYMCVCRSYAGKYVYVYVYVSRSNVCVCR